MYGERCVLPYAKAAEWCRANGVVSGTTVTTFFPNETMTHAMLLTILCRAAGSPAVTALSHPRPAPLDLQVAECRASLGAFCQQQTN